MLSRCLCVMLTLPLFLAADCTSAQDKKLSFKERWKLQLLPEKLPPGGDLSGTTWEQGHAMNILGEGSDWAISFPLPAADPRPFPSGEARIHLSTIHHGGFSGGESEVTHKYPYQVDGPFLEYDGLVRGYSVIKDQRLVLDPVFLVAPGKWYQLKSEWLNLDGQEVLPDKLPGFPRRMRDVQVTETLFEFEQDPLHVDQGQLTVHVHERRLREKAWKSYHAPWMFTVKRKVPTSSELRNLGVDHKSTHTEVSVPGTKLVFLDDKGECALVPDSYREFRGVFTPWRFAAAAAEPKH